MNYRSYLDLIMYKFFTLIDDVYIDKNTELLQIANKLYSLLTEDEQAGLVAYYLNQFSEDVLNNMGETEDINVTYPELTITKDIIDNFPNEVEIKQLLFNYETKNF